MKRILSMVLCAVLILSLNVYANDSAVTEKSNAEELSGYGIMKGDPDGDFRLDDELTRAEATVLLVRLYRLDSSEIAQMHTFSDMVGHWALNDVMTAKRFGIADGTSETTFSPDEKITAQEFLKMLVCLLGYKEVSEKKAPGYIGYIMQASQMGMTNSVPLITDKPLTRGQAAKLISNSLDIPIMVQTSFGKNNEYVIMNGKNGTEIETVRMELENR